MACAPVQSICERARDRDRACGRRADENAGTAISCAVVCTGGTLMRLVLILWCAVWCAGVCAQAAELQVQPEYLRTAPDGEVVAADHAAGGHARPSSLAGARAGYVSLQVIAKLHAAA